MHSAILMNAFGGRQTQIDQRYLVEARAASKEAGGTRGSVNLFYNLRLHELLAQRSASYLDHLAGVLWKMTQLEGPTHTYREEIIAALRRSPE